MADGRDRQEAGPGEAQAPPFSAKRFESTSEFANFKTGMKKLLAVPKAELDKMVRNAYADSPRHENPKAAGRKRKRDADT